MMRRIFFQPVRHASSGSGSGGMHGTTILCVRKANQLAMIGDGQVTLGNTVVKPNANKLRKLPKFNILAGFAGSTADAMALFERLESQLDQHNGQLVRASVELAKLWRSDKFMRHLDATLIVANAEITLQLTGSGDVVEAHDGVTAVGSGSPIALGAARALIDMPLTAEEIAIKALKVTAEIDIYTNGRYVLHVIEAKEPSQQ